MRHGQGAERLGLLATSPVFCWEPWGMPLRFLMPFRPACARLGSKNRRNEGRQEETNGRWALCCRRM